MTHTVKKESAKFQTLSYKVGLLYCLASCCDSLHTWSPYKPYHKTIHSCNII